MPLKKTIYKYTLKNRSQIAFNLSEQDRSNWDKRFKNINFFFPKKAAQKNV